MKNIVALCVGICSLMLWVPFTYAAQVPPTQVTGAGQQAGQCSGESCLNSAEFMLRAETFTPGGTFNGGQGTTFSERINWFLGTIIQNLVIIIGVIAVFIMTIGAGYMILNSGQDELVNKGKSMFMTGIYAVVIALSSYILIALVRYFIYATF